MNINDEEFPDQMTVMNVVTYNIADIVAQIIADRESSIEADGKSKEIEVTMEDVMEVIYEYAKDDLSCGWGHEVRIKELIFQDDRGNEW